MQDKTDFITFNRKTIVTYIVILIALAIATPALADYLGPDRTVTEWSSVCKIVLMECKYVPSKDDYRYKKVDDWSCSLESKPWKSYPDQPSSQGCFSATEGDQYVEQSEVLQQTTTTHPPATTTGTLKNCTLQNGWCVTAPQLDLAANEPLSGYNILAIEGTLNGQSFACPDSNCSITLNEGDNDFAYWALSSWGDGSTMGTLSAKVDSVSPTVGLDIIASNGTNGWFTSPAVISALGSDSGSGLADASLSVDGGVWQSSATLNEGIYNVSVRATDNAGNSSTSSTTISVDTTTPSLNVSINGTVGGNGWYKSITQVSAVASDVTSGISALEASINGGGYQAYTSPIPFSDGQHTVQFKATDNAGNVTESTIQSLSVDTFAPEIFIIESWELGEEVRYLIQDLTLGSGLASLRVVIEDEDERFAKVAWNEDVSGEKFSGYIDWDGEFKDGTVAPPGTYFVWIKASDIAGNEYVGLGRIIVPEPISLLRFFQPESVPTTNPTPPSELFEDDDLSSETVHPPLNPSTMGSLVFGGSTAQAGTSTTQSLLMGAGTSSSTTTSSNVLWGATAAAVLGAATAYALEENRKRKAAEEAQRSAILARIEAMEAQKKAAAQARKVAQWLEGQELAREEARLEAEARVRGLDLYHSSERDKSQTVSQSATSDFELEERSWIEEKLLADQQPRQKPGLQTGLSAYYSAMREGERLPNWWEQTKSFVKDNVIEPFNTYVFQPIVKPVLNITTDAVTTGISQVNEHFYQPFVKPRIEREIENFTHAASLVNEHVYQPIIKPIIDREIQEFVSGISWVNENFYQPIVKPRIEQEIENFTLAVSWVNDHLYQPVIKPEIEREIKELTTAISWVNEHLYQPFARPLVDATMVAAMNVASAVDTHIYQPVFQPVVSDIHKYVYQPLQGKASEAWDRYGEWVHGALDAAGFIPGFGEIADGLNGLIYLGEGRYVEATVSALAMIPILGDLGKAGKWTFKIGQEVLEEVAEKVIKETAEEVAEKIVKETAEEAAEIIAKESLEESTEKAVKEVAEEFVEKSTQETVEEAVEKTAKEIGEEIVEKIPQTAVEKTAQEAADEVATKVIKDVIVPESATKKVLDNVTQESIGVTEDQIDDIIRDFTERYGNFATYVISKYGDNGVALLQTYGDDAVKFVKRAEKLGVDPVEILDNPPLPGQTLEGWLLKIDNPENPVNQPLKLNQTDEEIEQLRIESIQNAESKLFAIGYGKDAKIPFDKMGDHFDGHPMAFVSVPENKWAKYEGGAAYGDFWEVNRDIIEWGIQERKLFVSNIPYGVATNPSPSSTRRFTRAEISLIEMPSNGYTVVEHGDFAVFVPNELIDSYNNFLPPELRLP